VNYAALRELFGQWKLDIREPSNVFTGAGRLDSEFTIVSTCSFSDYDRNACRTRHAGAVNCRASDDMRAARKHVRGKGRSGAEVSVDARMPLNMICRK
jgi:hypothetical protein